MIGPQGEAEHVGDPLVADPLLSELSNQAREDLVRGVREGGPPADPRRQLRDEDRGLADDGVDQHGAVHRALATSRAAPELVSKITPGGGGRHAPAAASLHTWLAPAQGRKPQMEGRLPSTMHQVVLVRLMVKSRLPLVHQS